MTIKLFNRDKKTDAKNIEKYSTLQPIDKELQRLLKIKDVLDEHSLVAITDKNGTITYVNKEFCRLSKYSENELIGQNHRILKSGYHPPQFYQGMWKTISHGKVWRGEVKNKAKDGTFYWVKTIIVPFLDNKGKPGEYVSVRTDVTAQKELQAQLLKSEKLTVIGELSARLAHDLRNPLSVIKNTIELIKIKNPDLPEKVLEDLYKLNRAILRMTHQIDDVLDFVKPKPLRLDRVSLLKTIYGSLERISKPPDVLPNIFEPLFTTKQTGTGLGLTSCKSIIEKHQGKINVRTEVGKGITFVIILPMHI